MNLSEDYFYEISKSCFKAMGIWPHDKSRLVLVQRIMILILLGTYLCIQFLIFLTAQFSIPLIVRAISSSSSFLLPFTAYIFYMSKESLILNLDVQYNENREIFRNKAEYDILQDNASANRLYFVFHSLYFVMGFVFVVLMQLLPIILDISLPLNESRKYLLIPVEYLFVSQDKYFYTKVLHEFVAIAVGGIIVYCIGLQYMLFVSHCIGVLKVARYRMQYFVRNSVSHVPKLNQKRSICKVIMHAVIVHHTVLKFINALMSTFNELLIFSYAMILIAISINLYGIIDSVMVTKDINLTFLCAGVVTGYLLTPFTVLHLAQKFSDQNIKFFTVIYSTSWYSMPVSSQKLILFLLQNGTKDYYIKTGFVVEGKMENFGKMVTASLSYVTVLYSCFNQ